MDYKKIIFKKNIKVICVDCFDTLLCRTCNSKKVLDLCFRSLAERLPVPEIIFKEIWNLSREVLTNRIKYLNLEEPSYEQLTSEIYSRLVEIYPSMSVTYLSFNKLFSDTMLETEKNVTILNTNLVNWLKKYKESGFKIICVSDFYMSSEWINKLLNAKKLNDLFDLLFVSSDYGLRKDTGHLYRSILETTECASYGEIFMIGDNKKSDYKIPKNLGMQSCLFDEDIVATKTRYLKKSFRLYMIIITEHQNLFAITSFQFFYFAADY